MAPTKKLTQLYPQRKRRTAHEPKNQGQQKIRVVQSQQPVVKKEEHKFLTKASSQPLHVGTSSDDGQRTADLKILRQFDMNWEYGPCTNITREERWNRAEKLEMDPPKLIIELITSHAGDPAYTDNVWADYKI